VFTQFCKAILWYHVQIFQEPAIEIREMILEMVLETKEACREFVYEMRKIFYFPSSPIKKGE